RQRMRFPARVVDLSVGPRHERFEVTARLRFGGKRGDFREAGRGPLVEIMKMLQLFEVEVEARIVRQLVQQRFQFGPMPPLAGDKFLQVDDHGKRRSDGVVECRRTGVLENWSDGVLAGWIIRLWWLQNGGLRTSLEPSN